MSDLRPGEIVVPLPDRVDAGLVFIGRVHSPWTQRGDCPRQGDAEAGPEVGIEIDPLWAEALTGLDKASHVQVLYWMHLSRRDLVRQSPRHDGTTTGTFALRSPVRPNPIASSLCRLIGITGNRLSLRGLDCVDGTPVLDLKPAEGCLK